MTRTPLLLTLAAAAALAGCGNNNDHTIVAGPDGDEANQAPAANAPVTLPPSILSTKIYRCKDNSVVYIDWLSDKKSANFRSSQEATPINLTAPEEGKPMVSDGYSLTGATGAKTISLTRPGKGAQDCNS